MQKSTVPTEYIMLSALTGSEWDRCDYIIVHITDEWKKTMRQRLQAALQFKEDYQFAEMNYYDSPEGFFLFADDDWQSFTGDTDKEWCYITISEDELSGLPVPENRLDCYSVSISKYGTAKYRAYGKHTGEEFWTTDFPIADFLGDNPLLPNQ